MRHLHRLLIVAVLALAGTLAGAPSAQAQQYSADKPMGTSAQTTPPYLKDAGVSQNLNQALPLADHFRDSGGADLPLAALFHTRPVVLALVYYRCRMLCPQVLHGMAGSLRQTGFRPGKDYDVVVASIDPLDAPSDAAAEKQQFLATLGDPSAAASVHFLTAQPAAIQDLSRATGFHYVRTPGPDGRMDQFAHSSVIMIATPEGRMSKYLSGIEYQPRDVRLALIQASHHHIGSATDLILLYCCSYSPASGRYTVSILRVLGLAAMASVLAMIALLYLLAHKQSSPARPA